MQVKTEIPELQDTVEILNDYLKQFTTPNQDKFAEHIKLCTLGLAVGVKTTFDEDKQCFDYELVK